MNRKETSTSRKHILQELRLAFTNISDNYKFIKKVSDMEQEVLGSGEWLLDNVYLIEKEYKSIKEGMPKEYFDNLPLIDGVPKILTYAKEYIDSRDVIIEEEDAIRYINNKDQYFTMGELWAFPLMLRIALILDIAKVIDRIVKVQKEKNKGKEVADKIIDNIKYSKKLLESLSEEGELTSLFLENLSKILHDNSIEDKEVWDFIISHRPKEYLKSNFIEGSIEEDISKFIGALRKVESINWRNFFTLTSKVEKILSKDPADTYKYMDFKSKDYYRHKIEKLSRKLKIDELTLVKKALELASKSKDEGEIGYKKHIGYYLIDEGVNELQKILNRSVKVEKHISSLSFVLINVFGSIFIILGVLGVSYMAGARFSSIKLIVSILLLYIPASEIIVTLINWSVSKIKPINFIPKLDFNKGVPYEDKTIVVIPAIVSSERRSIELMEQLEVYYHGNKDKNIYFALLGDLPDSKEKDINGDKNIIDAGLRECERLNNKYFKDENHFFFFNRERIFNEKENIYMGKERKRGKLMEFIALLKGEENHTYTVISSSIESLRDARYLITLDADTFMPKDSAKSLIGTMSHILNVPRVKDKKVIHGYGILQPKVSISLESKNKSPFSKIFAGDSGVDGYSIAYSDTYQDLFKEGSFVGKGIINIDAFYGILKDEFPENRVLSHDLLEGAYVKCGLVTDIEFIDNYPYAYNSSSERLHRWVRGDWQLISWIFSRKISLLSKWKIFDNLRRSLLSINLLAAILLNLFWLKEEEQIVILCFLAVIVPLIFTVTDFVVTPKNKIMGTFKNLEQILIIISFIPYQAYLMCDAIIRTLYRLTFSKKHLLQWKTAEEVENNINNSRKSYVKRMYISTIIGVLVIAISLTSRNIIGLVNIALGALWVISPYIAFYISVPYKIEEYVLKEEDKKYLRNNARRIWSYYEDFVNYENNYLAPDNYQEKPYKGVAYRTSPTNIGMGLISNIVAYDLGYITLGSVVDRIELILNGMDKLEMYKGHYLNWYDTRNCTPLWPRYVSTVDSGNLLGYLIIISNTLEEYKNNSIIRKEEIESLEDVLNISKIDFKLDREININTYKYILKDTLELILKKENNLKDNAEELKRAEEEVKKKLSYYEFIFGEEVEYCFDNLGNINIPSLIEFSNFLNRYIDNTEGDIKGKLEDKLKIVESLIRRIDEIIKRINTIIHNMNFKFLYNKDRGLFSIGFNIEENSCGNSYYDLLASESRATSFITIALNQVPKEHWFNLNRAMTNAFKGKTLVSWSGTMFEYFMPALIMKSYKDTLFSLTYFSVIKAQKEFAKSKNVPWGISESAYYQFDVDYNYQYKAFGVPGIGLKRGLEDELVISPYSTLISLPFSRDKGIENLKSIQNEHTFGKYGFIEAIDYTKSRVSKMDIQDEDGNSKNVKCYMVHHLGMSLMALDNILNKNIIQERFHKIPEVKANELLLKERIPGKIVFEREENFIKTKQLIKDTYFVPRIYKGAKRENPEILLLSNGIYSIMMDIAGSGYAKKNSMTVYRWKGDSTTDSTGNFIYIKNLNSNDYWSATYEPCKSEGEDYTVEFSVDKAKYRRKDGSIESQLEVVVSPEDDIEIRKVVFKNLGENTRYIETTSYMEVTLQSFEGDAVHPSFSNLFISTEYIKGKESLLGSRRARSKGGEVPYIFHKLISKASFEGAITYETSRVNFIGRNRNLENPKALDNDVTLKNTVGTVLDPIMSLRCRLRLDPGEEKTIYYITGTTNNREDALELIDKYSNINKLENSYRLYSKAIQIELNNLGIKSMQANIYQRLASYILFLHSGRRDREEYIKNISFSQEDLWPYGISGDLKIALVLVKSENDIDLVRSMIKMHYYWKSKGLKVDLVIYNDEEFSYEEPLQKNILSLVNMNKEGEVINKPGGIFIHNKSTMPKEIRDFLIGISALYVDSHKGSIITQVRDVDTVEKTIDLRHKELKKFKVELDVYKNELIEDKENLIEISNKSEFDIEEEDFNQDNLDFWNGYGGFDRKDKSYWIKLNKYNNTPAPWINVISNEEFGFHISEIGSAYTWSGNSRENKITPWSNDWVIDPLGEALFIRDEKNGKYSSITAEPVRDGGEYIIKHSFGYSTFSHVANGLKGEMTVFCPRNEKLKILQVKINNLQDEERSLSIYYYAQLVLGVFNYASARYITTYLKKTYIFGENPYSKYFGKRKAYLTIIGGENLSFTGDRKEFIGVQGSLARARALRYKTLSNNVGSIYDPCLACESTINLEANEEKEIIILLGQEENIEDIERIINKYKNIEEADKELEKVKEYWRDFLGNIQVETKDKAMNYLLNGWLLYQTYSCRYLSRSAFYQSGGAYGYRDQLQDSISLGLVDSNITKKQILRSASRQYLEGDVQHWWHPVINSGIRTRFSDDLLWLPYVTARYVNTTGDYSIFDEKAKYLEDEPLKEGEDERYTIVDISNEEGTIYEHCIKAIEKALKFGEHNIPLMGSGDWNDGMSTVGNKGKGESVWLGWFLYSILDEFENICKLKKDKDKAVRFKEYKEFIKKNLEKEAWDGGWYRRAYFDNGIPLGSRENEECQIDSLSQSWALISGAANKKRSIEAMEAVERNLVKRDKGMILLLTPPFEKSDLEPGYIKGYVAGVRENGGQYTHAAVWVILALTKLGLGDKALEYYNMINPINHTNTQLECRTYKVEPYVMAADVYIREPHGGRGGWSWYTGAAGWMYKVGIEDILGLKSVEGKGYRIEPCIPKYWNEYVIKINNEKEKYNIKIKRGTEKKLMINGKECEEKIIPKNKGKLDVIWII